MSPLPKSADTHDLAIAHDYLIPMGGAERVVASFHGFWPKAPIYTSAVNRHGLLTELQSADIRPSWMQHLPGIKSDFRRYFAIYPLAFLATPPVRARVLLISASTFAKCLRAVPGCTTICYCHAPTRFLWENSDYLLREIRSLATRVAIRACLPVLRRIDFLAAQRLNVIVANSEFVRDKIRLAYRREALVIHPPVDIDRFTPTSAHKGFYLIASRLVGYKGIEHAIAACGRLGRQLIIIGDGPDRTRLERLAGPGVKFLGRVPDVTLRQYLESCRAFIFPGVEDFGIAPVEAQACGKPVVALARGGALETIVPNETGVFFEEQSSDALKRALLSVEAIQWQPDVIRRNAMRFSIPRFESQMRILVGNALGEVERNQPNKHPILASDLAVASIQPVNRATFPDSEPDICNR